MNMPQSCLLLIPGCNTGDLVHKRRVIMSRTLKRQRYGGLRKWSEETAPSLSLSLSLYRSVSRSAAWSVSHALDQFHRTVTQSNAFPLIHLIKACQGREVESTTRQDRDG